MLMFFSENASGMYTTDFRRVYATTITEWLGYADMAWLLKGAFAVITMKRQVLT
jgi:hypothetical protein